jgi:hypothetical protein
VDEFTSPNPLFVDEYDKVRSRLKPTTYRYLDYHKYEPLPPHPPAHAVSSIHDQRFIKNMQKWIIFLGPMWNVFIRLLFFYPDIPSWITDNLDCEILYLYYAQLHTTDVKPGKQL